MRPIDRVEAGVKADGKRWKRLSPAVKGGRLVANSVRFYDEDDPRRKRLVVSGGPVWNPDGSPIDDQLTDGPAGFIAAGKPELGFGFRLRGNGGFVYSDDEGEITVGAPEWLSPTGYRVLPLTRRRVVENRVEWSSPQGKFVIAVKGGLVVTDLAVTAAEHLTGWRFSISGEPPNLIRGRYENGFLVYDPPTLEPGETFKFPLTVGL